MRRYHIVSFALITNFLLLGRFTFYRVLFKQQIESINREAIALNRSEEYLLEKFQHAAQVQKEIMGHLKSNYLRMKALTEYTRSYQIRIKGVPEENGEDLMNVVIEIGQHMDIKISADDITRINRVGTLKKKGMPRVIAVEFADLKLKAMVLRKASTGLLDTPYFIQDDVTNHVMPEAFSVMEEQDFPPACGYISSVSEPVTVTTSKKTFGAWLQDPIASSDGATNGFVWVLPHFYENNIVEEYASISDMKHRKIHHKYQLPFNWAGTGHVVYNGSLYFPRFGTGNIVRYQFATKSVIKEKRIPKALYGNDAPYQWSGSTDIDLSTDVSGLWAIYATYENTMDIVLGKVDPLTLEPRKSFMLVSYKTPSEVSDPDCYTMAENVSLPTVHQAGSNEAIFHVSDWYYPFIVSRSIQNKNFKRCSVDDDVGISVFAARHIAKFEATAAACQITSHYVLQTWRTNWRKQWSGNAFMMCGVLYVMKKYDERHTTLSYTYDTRIRRYRRVEIPFTNKYEWNTMLEYNHRTKMIYGWDRGYLVTYNVSVSRRLS